MSFIEKGYIEMSCLRDDVFTIWLSRYDRLGFGNNEFKPIFNRYIGIKDKDEYNNVLATLDDKSNKNKELTVTFDGSIPIIANFELIESINRELATMNVFDMANQDICVFSDSSVNEVFLKSMDYIIPIAIKNEKFLNDSVRNNFITKLIVWANTYLDGIKFDSPINPKCIYYGGISRHEIYFLMLAYLMTCDVLYINPLKEESAWNIDDIGLFSNVYKEMGIGEIGTFLDRVSQGKVIDSVESSTKKIKEDIHKNLFDSTNTFRPWQFRNGTTKSIFMDSVIEDLIVNWDEPAKVREGFAVKDDVVSVPCFFYKIEGVYDNDKNFAEFLNKFINVDNIFVINNTSYWNFVSDDNMYELAFCRLSDGTFNIDELKKVKNYKIDCYGDEIQRFLIDKFNETIKQNSIYSFKLTENDIFRLLNMIISMPRELVALVDNFDFPNKVPKIFIYLDNTDTLDKSTIMYLGYFCNIGLDILIFNPSAALNMSTVIKKDRVNVVRLDKITYNSELKKIKVNKKGSFLDKLRKFI